MSPVSFIFWRGHFGDLLLFFLSLVIILFAFLWFVSIKLFGTYIYIYMSETIVSIAIMQYKQSFYPICDLSKQTCKLGFFFLIILCFLLFFVTVAFFTAEKKGEGKGTCPITSYSRFWAVFILACKTGALWAKLGERRILGEARDEGRRKIKRLLPVHCSGCYYAGYVYIKGRIACKLLNALFYCGKSTKVYCYCVLFALV